MKHKTLVKNPEPIQSGSGTQPKLSITPAEYKKTNLKMSATSTNVVTEGLERTVEKIIPSFVKNSSTMAF